MTDSSRIRRNDLPPAPNRAAMEQAFEGYRAGLTTLTPEQLRAELTAIGSAIEAEQAARMESLMRSASSSSIDQPVSHSTPPASPWPMPSDARQADRGQVASAPRSAPAQSTPFELLTGSARTGPRLAAKIVLNSARRARSR